MTRYTIEVTENQAEIIRQALEVLSRLQIGQVWAATDYLPSKNDKYRDWEMQKAMENTYEQFAPHSYKRTDLSENAWYLMTVIRHRLAWDRNPEGNFMSVQFDKPINFGNEPEAKIERVK